MINHIVFFKFKDGISEKEISDIFSAIGNLRKKIPVIRFFSSGKNISLEGLSQGYTHGFVMKFNNLKDRDIYLADSDHQQIAEETIFPVLENGWYSVLVLDYEED